MKKKTKKIGLSIFLIILLLALIGVIALFGKQFLDGNIIRIITDPIGLEF